MVELRWHARNPGIAAPRENPWESPLGEAPGTLGGALRHASGRSLWESPLGEAPEETETSGRGHWQRSRQAAKPMLPRAPLGTPELPMAPPWAPTRKSHELQQGRTQPPQACMSNNSGFRWNWAPQSVLVSAAGCHKHAPGRDTMPRNCIVIAPNRPPYTPLCNLGLPGAQSMAGDSASHAWAVGARECCHRKHAGKPYDIFRQLQFAKIDGIVAHGAKVAYPRDPLKNNTNMHK